MFKIQRQKISEVSIGSYVSNGVMKLWWKSSVFFKLQQNLNVVTQVVWALNENHSKVTEFDCLMPLKSTF